MHSMLADDFFGGGDGFGGHGDDFFGGMLAPCRRHRGRDPFQSLMASAMQDMQAMQAMAMGGGMGGGGTSFAYSSSTVSMGGPGGPVYQRSITHRAGPGGVSETQESEVDSCSGVERLRVQRRLGDKARTVSKARYAGGREEHEDYIENMAADDVHQFDEAWQRAAEGRRAALPAPRRQPMLALPAPPAADHARAGDVRAAAEQRVARSGSTAVASSASASASATAVDDAEADVPAFTFPYTLNHPLNHAYRDALATRATAPDIAHSSARGGTARTLRSGRRQRLAAQQW